MLKRFASRMRRMKSWLMDYAYVVTMAAVMLVVAAGALYTHQVRTLQAQDIAAAAPAPEIRQTLSPAPVISPPETIAPIRVNDLRVKTGIAGEWPVGGAVIRGYEETEIVYWASLDSYRAHLGLDIAGETGEGVLCAADGIVRSAVRDALWGWRIIVDQEDGRQAVYAGLSDALVTPGQSVVRGRRIGLLMEAIPCEAEMGTHLHLELYRDGKAQDPEGMLPDRSAAK